MKKVACLGILVADVIVEPVENYPEKGVLEKVNSITVHNGGNAMTASINLKKLGVESSIVGMVGDDMFGDFLKKRLVEANVDTRGLKQSSQTQTSASVLMIDKTGERSFFHCVGTNAAFSIDDIDFDIIKECDIVFVTGTFLLTHFDGIETMEFLKKCKEMGKTTLLDVCWDSKGEWGKLLDMSMPYIDFLMPSIDEAVCIAGKEDPDDIADVFVSKGAKNVIIKLGSKGSYLRCENQTKGTVYNSFKVNNVVDTTGAGDSFCSGFIAALSMDKPLDECMIFANAVGAMSVMEKGATNGTKSYEETMEFIKNFK
ncbi:MAG: carbohydrate kinase family protein [Clostridia bacterium]|nr:carbohydrate kinase family protein [Clostridia bacterium]